MSNKNLYSIYDRKARLYAPPFLARTDAEAVRMFTQAVNDKDPQNLLHRFAEDYELAELGEFNEDAGIIETKPAATVIRGDQVKEA